MHGPMNVNFICLFFTQNLGS